MLLKFLYLVPTLLWARFVNSANILYLEGVPNPSHHIWNRALIRHLGAKGHNVTVLTVEHEKSTENVHYITMEGVYEAIDTEWLKNGSDNFARRWEFGTIKEMYDFNTFVSKKLVKTEGFKRLLNYPDNFQVNSIVHDFTAAQVLLGFSDKFNNPPLISVSPFGLPPHTYAVSGMLTLPSILPHFSSNYIDDMTILQRMKNIMLYTFDWIYRNVFFMKIENFLARKYFGENVTALERLERNTSVVLVNYDPYLDYPVPLPAGVKSASLIHCKRGELLGQVFKNLVNKPNESGIIIFSFGTNLRTELIDDEKIELFLDAFRQLPNYTVIMKFEPSRIRNAPANVHVFDYIPQDTLLSYSRVKILITNGGRLSLQEASWHGVPIIGVPLYQDQHQNVRKSVSDGFGIELDINNLSVEKILDAIKEIRENSNYKSVASARSAILDPKYATPVDFARYWIEHVTFNYGDLPQFHNPTIHMSFFTVYGLDVLSVISLFVLCYVIVAVSYFRNSKKDRKKKIVSNNKKEDRKSKSKKIKTN